jgi:hypothetical protein
MHANVNGDISFWYADMGGPPAPGPPLQGDIEADVAIVGAGYTGLWTAYYIKQAAPSLRVVLLEREFAGFGASGRNGGQLVGGFAWSREKYLARSTRQAVIDMQDAMAGTVDEIIAVAERENIEADILRVDNMYVATNAAQLHRLKSMYEEARQWDSSAVASVELIGANAARARINVRNVLGALVVHGAARVQPAKLVRGLAVAAGRMGAQIFEQTRVLGLLRQSSARRRGSRRGCRDKSATGSPLTAPKSSRSRCRKPSGGRSAGKGTNCLATKLTPIATPSEPVRAASPWAAVACHTASARAPTFAV